MSQNVLKFVNDLERVLMDYKTTWLHNYIVYHNEYKNHVYSDKAISWDIINVTCVFRIYKTLLKWTTLQWYD